MRNQREKSKGVRYMVKSPYLLISYLINNMHATPNEMMMITKIDNPAM